MSVREQLYDLISEALPADHRVINDERGLDVIDRPIVQLSQRTIVRHPAAPNGSHLVTFNVRVIAPGTNPETSEDTLDDLVEGFLYALGNLEPRGIVAWTRAEKAMTEAGNLAYDIDLSVTTDKPSAPELTNI